MQILVLLKCRRRKQRYIFIYFILLLIKKWESKQHVRMSYRLSLWMFTFTTYCISQKMTNCCYECFYDFEKCLFECLISTCFSQIVEDELLYATVNHSGAGENCAPAVKFESGSDYATVIIHWTTCNTEWTTFSDFSRISRFFSSID